MSRNEEQLAELREDFSEARQWVFDHVDENATILGLIEECSETIQAAMKRYRAINAGNPTPVTPTHALLMLREETGDLLMMLDAYGLLPTGISTDHNPKWLRWAQRLGYEGS